MTKSMQPNTKLIELTTKNIIHFPIALIFLLVGVGYFPPLFLLPVSALMGSVHLSLLVIKSRKSRQVKDCPMSKTNSLEVASTNNKSERFDTNNTIIAEDGSGGVIINGGGGKQQTNNTGDGSGGVIINGGGKQQTNNTGDGSGGVIINGGRGKAGNSTGDGSGGGRGKAGNSKLEVDAIPPTDEPKRRTTYLINLVHIFVFIPYLVYVGVSPPQVSYPKFVVLGCGLFAFHSFKVVTAAIKVTSEWSLDFPSGDSTVECERATFSQKAAAVGNTFFLNMQGLYNYFTNYETSTLPKQKDQ
jgi:hypothetical protein